MSAKYNRSKHLTDASNTPLCEKRQREIIDELRTLICCPLEIPVEPEKESSFRAKRRDEPADRLRHAPNPAAIPVAVGRRAI
jgi:hypothetical protein